MGPRQNRAVLFVGDPLSQIRPTSDTSLVLLREAIRRRFSVYWVSAEEVEYHRGRVLAAATPCLSCERDQLPDLGEKSLLSVEKMSYVLIRKDPPFDSSYMRLCWLLALVEKETRFLNLPSALLRYHEKLIPLEALSRGYLNRSDIIPTYIGERERVEKALKGLKAERVVSKPFLGYAGKEIKTVKWSELDSLPISIDRLTQPYLSDVEKNGDRRVFFLNGKLLTHFVRLPPQGGFISNLAQGGKAVAKPLSAREKVVIQRLGRFLKVASIEFAGADLIAAKVSEVNITSPTGLRAVEELEGCDYASEIWEYLLARRN